MKLDQDYSFIYVCPQNGEQLSEHEVYYSSGICPRCGHDDNSSITHEKQVVGRWNRPSFWEGLAGKRHEFLRKEEEDAVMNALKGEHL